MHGQQNIKLRLFFLQSPFPSRAILQYSRLHSSVYHAL